MGPSFTKCLALSSCLRALCITNPDSTKDECHGPQLGVKGVKFMKIDL